MKRHILLVDPDTRGRRMLEVSLRKAGYTVDPVDDGEAAIRVVSQGNADLVLTDTDLPGMSGFDLVVKLRESNPGIGIMFLSGDTSLKSKVRGLELGVDYLSKPAYLKEVITRVELELDRRERLRFTERGVPSSFPLFKGSLEDMALVDLFQTISMGQKSGELFLRNDRQNGSVWFRDGDVIDAECKGLTNPKRALMRFFLWTDGQFELRLGDVDRPATIEDSTSAIIGEGMRRLDEWGRLLEQVPPLESKLYVNANELLRCLAGLPEDLNPLLSQLNGDTSLDDVLLFADGDEIELLKRICGLYFEGVVSEDPTAVSIVPSEIPERDAGDTRSSIRPLDALPTSRPPVFRNSDRPIGATTLDYLEALEIDMSLGQPEPDTRETFVDTTSRNAMLPAAEASPKTSEHGLDEVRAEEDVVAEEAAAVERRHEASPPIQAPEIGRPGPADTIKHDVTDLDEAVRGRTLRPAPVVSVPAPAEGSTVSFPGKPPAPNLANINLGPSGGLDFDDASEEETSPSVPAASRHSMNERPLDDGPTQEHTLISPAPDLGDPEARPSLSAHGVRSRIRTNPPVVMPPNRVPQELAQPERQAPEQAVQQKTEQAVQQETEQAVQQETEQAVQQKTEQAVQQKTEQTGQAAKIAAVLPNQQDAAQAYAHSGLEPVASDDQLDHLAESEEEKVFFSDPPNDVDPQPVDTWAEPPSADDKQMVPLLFVGVMVLLIGVFIYNMSGDESAASSASSSVTREGVASAAGDPAKPQTGELRTASQASKNAEQTRKEPTNEALQPDEQTAKPDEQTAQPDEQTAQPDEQTAQPDEQTAQPDEQTARPDEQTAQPDEQTAKPDEQTAKPDDVDTPSKGYETLLAEARAQLKRRKRKKAETLYRQAIETNPAGSEALADLSLLLMEQSRLREAGELAERSINIDQTNSKGWVVFGFSLQSQGKRAAAMEAYRKCAQLGKGDLLIECKRMAR